MLYSPVYGKLAKNLQLGAGILLTSFTPSTGVVEQDNIIGATNGGCAFTATPNFVDYGDDIDNVHTNTKELKAITNYEVKLSGTLKTLNTTVAKNLIAAADIDSTDDTKITAREYLNDADFHDIWWVGDYSDSNETSGKAGFIAIKLSNAINTSGLSIQSSDGGTGEFSFEYTAHYTLGSDAVPFELYVKEATE